MPLMRDSTGKIIGLMERPADRKLICDYPPEIQTQIYEDWDRRLRKPDGSSPTIGHLYPHPDFVSGKTAGKEMI